jgi:hypothetical protein
MQRPPRLVDHAQQEIAAMKPRSVSIPVPNAILFIQDPSIWDLPEPVGDSGIWATSRGITLTCMHEQEGNTDITMGSIAEIRPTQPPIFDGYLDSPDRRIVLQIVPGDIIFEQKVKATRTRVKIWTDGSRWPTKVVVGVD